jgi:hypothetical protein
MSTPSWCRGAGDLLDPRVVRKVARKVVSRAFPEVLLRLLRQRFGAQVDAPVEQRIMTASVEQIETWSMRVLSAATLAELFAD